MKQIKDILPQAIPWRHAYDFQRDAEERAATDITCRDESLTQQHFTEDADLNVIAKRFGITDGAMPVGPIDPRHYGDFSDAPDLRTALDITRSAQQQFMALPAKLRARFHNDPGELWTFINDAENADEAVRLGLLKRPEAQPPETPKGGVTPPPEDPPKTP